MGERAWGGGRWAASPVLQGPSGYCSPALTPRVPWTGAASHIRTGPGRLLRLPSPTFKWEPDLMLGPGWQGQLGQQAFPGRARPVLPQGAERSGSAQKTVGCLPVPLCLPSGTGREGGAGTGPWLTLHPAGP